MIWQRQIIYKHYQRILAQWPVDRLRPNISFQKVIQERVDARLNSPASIKESPTSNENPKPPAEEGKRVPPFDEKAELEQVNVLYSFLENRYSKKVRTVNSVNFIEVPAFYPFIQGR